MSSTRLTQLEIEAVTDVLNERLAGGTDDLKDAFGIEYDEAERIMVRLERALAKLNARIKPKRTK